MTYGMRNSCGWIADDCVYIKDFFEKHDEDVDKQQLVRETIARLDRDTPR